MSEGDYETLKQRLLAAWERILEIAATVPGAAETARLLALAGCPTDPRELGLGADEIALGLKNAHYIRDRFTIKKLSRLLAL